MRSERLDIVDQAVIPVAIEPHHPIVNLQVRIFLFVRYLHVWKAMRLEPFVYRLPWPRRKAYQIEVAREYMHGVPRLWERLPQHVGPLAVPSGQHAIEVNQECTFMAHGFFMVNPTQMLQITPTHPPMTINVMAGLNVCKSKGIIMDTTAVIIATVIKITQTAKNARQFIAHTLGMGVLSTRAHKPCRCCRLAIQL